VASVQSLCPRRPLAVSVPPVPLRARGLAVVVLLLAVYGCVSINGKRYPGWTQSVAATGCTVAPEFPENKAAMLTVVVLDANGQRLQGVGVRVSDADIPGSETVNGLTDCEGRYHLTVRPARWRVELTLKGIRSANEILTVHPGQACGARFFVALSESTRSAADQARLTTSCIDRRWQSVPVDWFIPRR
jgi:hypothetical protein